MQCESINTCSHALEPLEGMLMTVKQLALLTLNEGPELESFSYDAGTDHAPEVLQFLPGLEEYRASKLIKEDKQAPAHLPRSPNMLDIDFVAEFWFAEELPPSETEDRALADNICDFIIAKNPGLFGTSGIQVFRAEEWRTSLVRLMPQPIGHAGPPAVKMLIFLNRREGMSRDAFVNYYEARHAELALSLLSDGEKPIFSHYARNYPVPQGPGVINESNASSSLGFDVMAEICFWTERDYNQFLELCAQAAIAAELSTDEMQLFDRRKVRIALAEEVASTERRALGES